MVRRECLPWNVIQSVLGLSTLFYDPRSGQMGAQTAAQMKADNVNWLRENKIDRIETNAIYALGQERLARRPGGDGHGCLLT